MGNIDRRAVLALGAGGALTLGLDAGRALAAAESGPAVREIADGVVLIGGPRFNVVAARGPGGAVLVDGGLPEQAPAVLDLALQRLKARKVETLFNTSWRPERTGGNDTLGAQGVRIVAHENTRLWMGRDVPVRWENKTYPRRAKAARPTDTFYTDGSLQLGKEQADYGYLLQAHTDGDAYVFFRRANVLACGGAVSGEGWPMIDWATGGWIGAPGPQQVMNTIPIPTFGGMNAGLQALIGLSDDKTVIVPGRGPVLTREDLRAQAAMYGKIADRLREMLYKGYGVSDVLAAAPAKEYESKMGDSKLFVTLAFQSLWGHLAPDA